MCFNNIVAAIDFSAVSGMVLEQSLALAESSAGKVNLVHAFSLSELSEAALRAPRGLLEAEAVAERELRNLAEPHLASGRVGKLIVREGDPASVLSKVAHELQADLIVVDTYHRGLVRLAHGSVTAGLVRDAPCDVLVLRRAASAR